MKIIDAHMHFFRTEGFDQLAKAAGGENTADYYLQTCRDNHIVMSVAMGNAPLEPSLYGGVVPRVPNLARPFTLTPYNQPKAIAYCAGVDSNALTEANCEATAKEFERVLRTPQCVGIKIYLGYSQVYAYDKRHFPLYELAERYGVPVAFHTGETAGGKGLLRYAHPGTIEEVAKTFPNVNFVICHCGSPWVLDAMEVAAVCPNVYVDLSGLVAGKLPGKEMYHKFRAFFQYLRMWLDYTERYDRLLYGTDWPLVNSKSYIELMQEVIPEEHWQAFFYDNALRVYSKLQTLLPKEELR